jgi:hypothetical protein
MDLRSTRAWFARVIFFGAQRGGKERPFAQRTPRERPIDAQLSTSNVSQDDRKTAGKLESNVTRPYKKKPGEGARQAAKRLIGE